MPEQSRPQDCTCGGDLTRHIRQIEQLIEGQVLALVTLSARGHIYVITPPAHASYVREVLPKVDWGHV